MHYFSMYATVARFHLHCHSCTHQSRKELASSLPDQPDGFLHDKDGLQTLQQQIASAAAQVPLDDRDVYLIEAESFINAIKSGNADGIESLYEDSALSYQATQWITAASSENRNDKSASNA